MSRLQTVYRVLVAAALALAATACHTTPSEPPQPVVRTVEVAVQVPVPCPALDQLGPEPVYPDTADAIANADGIGELARLYATGRLMRIQRLAEYAAVKQACKF